MMWKREGNAKLELFLKTNKSKTKLNDLKLSDFLSRFERMKEKKMNKKMSSCFLSYHINSKVETMHKGIAWWKEQIPQYKREVSPLK